MILINYKLIWYFSICFIGAAGCINYQSPYDKLGDSDVASYDQRAVLMGEKNIYIYDIDGKKGKQLTSYLASTAIKSKDSLGAVIDLAPGPHKIVFNYSKTTKIIPGTIIEYVYTEPQTISFEAKGGYTYGFDVKIIDGTNYSITVVPKIMPMRGGGKVRPVWQRPRPPYSNKELMDTSKTAQIKEGKTTKDEIKALLGEPMYNRLMPSGNDMWYYASCKNKQSKSLSLLFNEDGILQKLDNFDKTIDTTIANEQIWINAKKDTDIAVINNASMLYEDRRIYLKNEISKIKPDQKPLDQEVLIILPSDNALKERLKIMDKLPDFEITVKKFTLVYDFMVEGLKQKNIFRKVCIIKSDNPEKHAKDDKLTNYNLVIYNRWDGWDYSYKDENTQYASEYGSGTWLIKRHSDNTLNKIAKANSIKSFVNNVKVAVDKKN
jgi:hypothetical protein